MFLGHAKIVNFDHPDSKSKYSEDDIIKMLEFLVDYIWVPVNWETEKNEKKRKETERKKNEKKTWRKVTKRNEKKTKRRNETKDKEKKRKKRKETKRNEKYGSP